MKWFAPLAAALLALTSCQKSAPERLGYQIVSTRPHDSAAYTQGLQLTGGRLDRKSVV